MLTTYYKILRFWNGLFRDHMAPYFALRFTHKVNMKGGKVVTLFANDRAP